MTDKENPKISVVCPTYNSSLFIIKTLNTILNQKQCPFELIVSDDGSTDDTIKKVESLFQSYSGSIKTKIINNNHKGPGATRNSGILESKGEWIAFIDSDDLWFDEKIKIVSDVILKDPTYNFIFHNENNLKFNGELVPFHDFSKFYKKDQTLTFQVWKYCIFHTSTVVCKKSLLLKNGLFDENLMSSQDWDLWIKMSFSMNYYHIPKVLGTYVDRKSNITNTKSFKGFLDRIRVMSRYWKVSGASFGMYIYMFLRRLIGFILKFLKIIK